MIKDLLPEGIFDLIKQGCNLNEITEIRLRTGKPLSVAEYSVYYFPADKDGRIYTVTKEDVEYVLGVATKHSVYAVNNQLASGFLSCEDGVRIGVSGEGVYKNGKLFTVKNVNFLCIRIPRQIFGCASGLKGIIDDFDNTVIVSPPGMGKTTVLRETVRLLSEKGKNILLIDERNELSASVNGIPSMDLGPNTDVLLFSSKKGGYADAVRAMRPDIIATDEIFGKEEIECLSDINRCGIKVLATVHAKDTLSLLKDKTYCALAAFTRYFAELGELGKITTVIDKERLKKC